MNLLRSITLVILFFMNGQLNAQEALPFSADSLFNLGNRAYEMDKLDEAIYHFEKAKLLDPYGKDIAINLQLANESLSTDIIEIEPFFLASWWKNFNNLLLPGGWKLLSLVFIFALLAIVMYHNFKSEIIPKRLFHSVVMVLIISFLLSVFAGNSRSRQIFTSSIVIVFGQEQSLYLGPDTVSESVKTITGGDKLRVLDEVEEWYKVSAMDSEQGWIMKDKVKRIAF